MPANGDTRGLRASTWLLTASGVWLVGLGAYFVILRPALLPEDSRYMGTTMAQLRDAAPGLEFSIGTVTEQKTVAACHQPSCA